MGLVSFNKYLVIWTLILWIKCFD